MSGGHVVAGSIPVGPNNLWDFDFIIHLPNALRILSQLRLGRLKSILAGRQCMTLPTLEISDRMYFLTYSDVL